MKSVRSLVVSFWDFCWKIFGIYWMIQDWAWKGLGDSPGRQMVSWLVWGFNLIFLVVGGGMSFGAFSKMWISTEISSIWILLGVGMYSWIHFNSGYAERISDVVKYLGVASIWWIGLGYSLSIVMWIPSVGMLVVMIGILLGGVCSIGGTILEIWDRRSVSARIYVSKSRSQSAIRPVIPNWVLDVLMWGFRSGPRAVNRYQKYQRNKKKWFAGKSPYHGYAKGW